MYYIYTKFVGKAVNARVVNKVNLGVVN